MELLPLDEMAASLVGFSAPEAAPTHASTNADHEVACSLAVGQAAIARFDAIARRLSPTPAADAQASFLCAQEGARETDRHLIS